MHHKSHVCQFFIFDQCISAVFDCSSHTYTRAQTNKNSGYLGGGEDYRTHEADGFVDLHEAGAPALNYNGNYSTDLFANKAIARIQAFSASQQRNYQTNLNRPNRSEIFSTTESSFGAQQRLFLYLPFQAVHSPLEAPKAAVARYANLSNPHRAIAAAMTSLLDAALKRVVDTLKAESLWAETLLIFTADNGGPPYVANSNAPLRGGKTRQSGEPSMFLNFYFIYFVRVLIANCNLNCTDC